MQKGTKSEFSVLLSVYKADNAAWLKRAVISVTAEQILKPKQVVLVKDGPVSYEVDLCIQELKELLSKLEIEFTVVSQKENRGLAAALNKGLKYCKYELVARMDADDIALPERFMLQVQYLNLHTDITILGGSIQEFENETESLKQLRETPCENDEIIKMMKTRNAMNHMTIVYKKDAILQLGGYSENFGKLEDYKLWIDAISAGFKLHNLQEILVKARVGKDFIKRRSNKREIQDWDMLQSYLLDAKLISKKKALLNKIYIRIFIYMPSFMKKVAYKTILRKKQ